MTSRTHKDALQYLREQLGQHPLLNAEVANAIIEHDNYSQAVKIGGDEAQISEWFAVVVIALKDNP